MLLLYGKEDIYHIISTGDWRCVWMIHMYIYDFFSRETWCHKHMNLNELPSSSPLLHSALHHQQTSSTQPPPPSSQVIYHPPRVQECSTSNTILKETSSILTSLSNTQMLKALSQAALALMPKDQCKPPVQWCGHHHHLNRIFHLLYHDTKFRN